MKKRWVLLLAVSVLCLGLGAAIASEPRAAAPEEVTGIDLRTALGEDAMNLRDAWMLGGDVFAFLLNHSETPYGGYEIVVWDRGRNAILSRTPVPGADYPRGQSWEEGVCTLWFTTWNARERDDYGMPTRYLGPDACIRAGVSPEGAVEIRYFTQDWTTVMPGGRVAVHTTQEGSLVAVDMATGEEELLLQGVPSHAGEEETIELASRYVPFWDELPDAPEGREFEFIPFVPDGHIDSIREFYVVQPLDEHRFVYEVQGWEWGAGFGVYDLETREDHRMTGRGAYLGRAGDALVGEVLRGDVHTYETAPLPETVQDALGQVVYSWWNEDICCYALSPDGTLLAQVWRTYLYEEGWEPGSLRIIDLQTGDVLQTYSIDHPLAYERSLFYGQDGRLMLFCGAMEGGSPYLYLFP